MSRAEELALKAYPANEVIVYGPLPGANEPNRIDDNLKYRIGYIEGYEQAEKDTLEMAVNWLQSRLNKQGFLDYDDIFDLRSLIVGL